MKDRIKKIRNHFNLTQEQFAKRIGLKQNTVATYEMGRSSPSDTVVNNICKEFSVREDWLRDGDGPMFNDGEIDVEFTKWVAKVLKSEPDSFKRRFLKMLQAQSEEDWKALEQVVTSFGLNRGNEKKES